MREQLPEILEIGLQYSRPLSMRAFAQVLEFLAFRPSPAMQTQINRLLSKNKAGTLTADKESELDRIGDLEHILIALKARARQQLDQAQKQTPSAHRAEGARRDTIASPQPAAP